MKSWHLQRAPPKNWFHSSPFYDEIDAVFLAICVLYALFGGVLSSSSVLCPFSKGLAAISRGERLKNASQRDLCGDTIITGSWTQNRRTTIWDAPVPLSYQNCLPTNSRRGLISESCTLARRKAYGFDGLPLGLTWKKKFALLASRSRPRYFLTGREFKSQDSHN